MTTYCHRFVRTCANQGRLQSDSKAIKSFVMSEPRAPDNINAVDAPVADSRGNWVDSLAPAWTRPYLRLGRLDRPIGTWLLLWPCWWSLAMIALHDGTGWPDPVLIVLFGLGAIAMRGAGCTFNDLVDRDFDAQVARTRSRPIPSGQVSVAQAKLFLVLQCLLGLAVLLQFNLFAIALGAASLVIVAVYPFMKRVTYWPQLFLGLAFNWGALLGWAAVSGSLSAAPVVLYVTGICWTLGYDTIYAHQDKEDDALLGLKSTALRFGDATRTWLIIFYGAALLFFGLAGMAAAIGWIFYLGLAVGGWHLMRQVTRTRIDDPARCLAIFKSNRDFGVILFAAILAGTLGSGLH